MKKYIIYILIAVGIGGFYLYDKIKKNNLHTEICRDFLNVTSEMSECKKDPNNYMLLLSEREAEKIIDKYIARIKEMEKIVLEHNESLPSLDTSKYKYLNANQIYYKFNRKKFYNRKIVLGGTKRDCTWPTGDEIYFFCLKQKATDLDSDKEVSNSIIVVITNIDDFSDKSKYIFDEFHKALFGFFDVTVYGELVDERDNIFSTSMNAEQITFEITDYHRYQILSTIKFALFRDHLDKFKNYLKKKKNK